MVLCLDGPDEAGRLYNTVVLDDQAAAEGFVGYVRSDVPAASAAGVHLHSLEILDVIGSA